MTVRGYQLAALWSRGGDYTGTLEDVSAYVLDDPEVEVEWGRSEPRATADAKTTTLSFGLRNDGRQFSPENASSPIVGMVPTGTPVRLTVTDPANGATTGLFSGPINSYDVNPTAPAKDFTAACSDARGKPWATKLSTPVYQGLRTGTLIATILDLIGWPVAARDVNWGVTVVPNWWLEDVDAETAINDLVHSEGVPACAWVQNGIFYYRDRLHRVVYSESQTSRGTYTHTIPAGAVAGDHKILTGSFTYNHGVDHVINSATLEVAPRAPAAQQAVWSTDDQIALGSGETVTFDLRFDDPCVDLQVPQASYVAVEDGAQRSDYHLASGSVTPSLSRTSGQSAVLTLTAGGGGAILDLGITVRGKPLKQGAVRKFSAADPVSQAKYGLSDWGGTAPWAHYYDAQVICDRLVGIYSLPRPSVTFDVDGVVKAATLTRALATQISDRITVRNDELGLNADFFVEQVKHTVFKLGLRHRVTIGAQVVEPTQAAQPFIFDTPTPTVNGFNAGQFGMDSGNNPDTMFMFDVSGQGFNDGVFAT